MMTSPSLWVGLAALLSALTLGSLGGCAQYPALDHLPAYEESDYRLASGDQVRVLVFGQDAISQDYTVNASGRLSIPLVGSVRADGKTTAELEQRISYLLRSKDLVKSPEVAIEIQAYRPFFLLGEVKNSGQYKYVPGLSVQEAIATAGGYTIYAYQEEVVVTRVLGGEKHVGLLSPFDRVAPGDTIRVEERLF